MGLKVSRLPTAIAALAVALAAVAGAVPGAAQARIDWDPCALPRGDPDPHRPYRDPPGFTDRGRVCGVLGRVAQLQTVYTPDQWWFADPEANDLPSDDIRQCPAGTRIPGTDYWGTAFSYNWDWDYYVEGGEWALWNGQVPYIWPQDGVLPGGEPGYSSAVFAIHNWLDDTFDHLDVRVFWSCEPAGPSTDPPPAPPKGDVGENTLRGGAGDDALVGFAGSDRLRGRAGNDHLHGGLGRDTLLGGAHDDLLHGGLHGDKAVGGAGHDDILAGPGNDVSIGGEGGDRLFDDEGRDKLIGGPGNDRFSARDGDRDVIRCGSGTDIAIIDRRDVAVGCEHAFRSAREQPRQMPKI